MLTQRTLVQTQPHFILLNLKQKSLDANLQDASGAFLFEQWTSL